MKTNSKALATFALSLVSLAAFADPQSFDFTDPKGINNAGFKLDAPLEAISGNATGVSGKVNFDPSEPAKTTGKIVIKSSSLRLPNSMQQQHMQGENWLDVAKFPDITFEAKELKNVKTDADVTTADVAGVFTLKGVAKEITVPVKFTYLKGKLGQRVPRMQGDLLVIRSNFSIKRGDFGINSGKMEDKVANEIELALSIAGASPK